MLLHTRSSKLGCSGVVLPTSARAGSVSFPSGGNLASNLARSPPRNVARARDFAVCFVSVPSLGGLLGLLSLGCHKPGTGAGRVSSGFIKRRLMKRLGRGGGGPGGG